jgi:hypothetical protein
VDIISSKTMTKLFIKHTTLVFQFTLQNNNYLTKTRIKRCDKNANEKFKLPGGGT